MPSDLMSLDRLIADVGGAGHEGTQSRSSHGLLLEHLRAARTNLLGAMLSEYKSSLQEAKESAGCVADKTSQVDFKERLRKLIGD